VSGVRKLDRDELEQYERDGFVLLKGLYSQARLRIYDERFRSLVTDDSPLPVHMKIMKDVMVVKGAVTARSPEHAVNKLMSFEDDPVLYDFVTDPDLLSCVRDLLGDDLYSVTTNVFNKPPDVDGRHPMHQDLRYFRIGPPEGIVGVWTAILPAKRESGCLAVIPGSHRQGLLPHDDPDWEYVNRGFHGIQDIDRSRRVHVEMEPGDTLLFHPLLVHGSGRNRGDDFRRAISAHFAAAGCESPPPDWRENPYVRRLPPVATIVRSR
jgi:phytanoyl-CoA hydroxylase